MTVYVDNFRAPPASAASPPAGRTWSPTTPTSPNCTSSPHRSACSAAGSKPANTPTGPHYDVTDTKRTAALAAGAVAIDVRELSDVLARARNASKGSTT